MMHFKNGLELTELQNMKGPEDDNISNDSNDFPEVENGPIDSNFIADRESRRSLTNSHLEKKKCDEYVVGTTSFGMSVFNLSNAIMGSGILGLAYALANTGIILFLTLLCSVAMLSVYSINLLLLCAKKTGCMVFEKVGEEIFGTTGRFLVFGAIFLQNIGGILSYLFIVKAELPPIIKYLMGKEEEFSAWYMDGRVLLVLVTLSIILPLCLLKNLGYLGYASGLSLSCMVFFLVVIIYKKFEIPCIVPEPNSTVSANSTNADLCEAKYVTLNSKTVYALPTIAFAFVCHPSVLPIYYELKNRSMKRMQMVTNISFFAIFLMYLLTAVFGYLTFYGRVLSDLLHQYPSKDDILMLLVRLAVIMAVILTVPVLFFTIRISLFELAQQTTFNLCRHVFVTITLLAIMNCLVIFIPTMKDIFGVVGVTSSNMLIFILPSCLYLKVTSQDAHKRIQRISAALFLGMGVLFSMVSIPLVIYDWIISMNDNQGH